MFKWLFGSREAKQATNGIILSDQGDSAVALTATKPVPELSAVDECTLKTLSTETSSIYFTWLFSGNFETLLPPSAQAKKQLQDLELRLRDAKVEDLGLPRQPNILPRLMSLMKDKSASSEKLVELISSDAGFTVKILSMANSPFFRVTEEPITDIKRALVYLGEEGLQKLVTTTLLQPILVLKSKHSKTISEQLYYHVFLCAEIGAWLATNSPIPPQNLHLLGLLQGTGNITLLSFVDAYHEGTGSREMLNDDEVSWILSQLFMRHSRRLAYIVAKHWELGADIELALAHAAAPGNPKYRNETSDMLLASIISTRVKLLNDEDLIDTEQAEAWVKGVCVSPDVLDKTFNGS